jgi:hypothetical protein
MTPPEPWIGSQKKAATFPAPSAFTFSRSAATLAAMTARGSSPTGLR